MLDVSAQETAEEIIAYWNERSASYSSGVVGELGDGRRERWRTVLMAAAEEALREARASGRVPLVIDLGCGPGFFTSLFCDERCRVEAVDASVEMLARARENVADRRASFTCCDVADLPYDDDAFDLAVARNVTWVMQEPETAYAEWLRVLRPGGKLLVFDANWYRYLVDEAVAAARRADQEGNVLEGWDDTSQATSDEERRCEDIARGLPLTYRLRPEWDIEALEGIGFSRASFDEEIWKSVWTDNERSYYRSTPLFMIEAVK